MFMTEKEEFYIKSSLWWGGKPWEKAQVMPLGTSARREPTGEMDISCGTLRLWTKAGFVQMGNILYEILEKSEEGITST